MTASTHAPPTPPRSVIVSEQHNPRSLIIAGVRAGEGRPRIEVRDETTGSPALRLDRAAAQNLIDALTEQVAFLDEHADWLRALTEQHARGGMPDARPPFVPFWFR